MGGSVSKKADSDERLARLAELGDVPQLPPAALRAGAAGAPPPPMGALAGGAALAAGTPLLTGGIPGAHSAPQLQGGSALAPATALEPAGGTFIPTVFRWEHGGNAVYITGAFNQWSSRVPMHRSGNDFVYIASLPRGKHAYKFIVDDEWRFAPDQPTVPDGAGNINNLMDLTSFRPDDDTAPLQPGAGGGLARKDSLPGMPYGHAVPDEDEFTKEPPLLPPQLRSIVLNAGPPDPWDPGQLPVPNHVTLNHLYCTAIKDGLMVQAVTSRYRRKHVTSVLYSIMPLASATQAQMAQAQAMAAAQQAQAQQQQQQQQQFGGGAAYPGGDGGVGGAPPSSAGAAGGGAGGSGAGGSPSYMPSQQYQLHPAMTTAQALAAGFVPQQAPTASALHMQIFTVTLPLDLLGPVSSSSSSGGGGGVGVGGVQCRQPLAAPAPEAALGPVVASQPEQRKQQQQQQCSSPPSHTSGGDAREPLARRRHELSPATPEGGQSGAPMPRSSVKSPPAEGHQQPPTGAISSSSSTSSSSSSSSTGVSPRTGAAAGEERAPGVSPRTPRTLAVDGAASALAAMTLDCDGMLPPRAVEASASVRPHQQQQHHDYPQRIDLEAPHGSASVCGGHFQPAAPASPPGALVSSSSGNVVVTADPSHIERGTTVSGRTAGGGPPLELQSAAATHCHDHHRQPGGLLSGPADAGETLRSARAGGARDGAVGTRGDADEGLSACGRGKSEAGYIAFRPSSLVLSPLHDELKCVVHHSSSCCSMVSASTATATPLSACSMSGTGTPMGGASLAASSSDISTYAS